MSTYAPPPRWTSLRRYAVAIALPVLCALWLVAPPRAAADARSDYLIQLLQASSQFRVRAQAAISLGSIEGNPAVLDALGRALKDEHPAVRAAAANSLGRIADPRSLAALKSAASDREAPVRQAAGAAVARVEAASRSTAVEPEPVQPEGPARFYVAVGVPASRAPGISASDLMAAQQVLRVRLQQVDGVKLAPEDETAAAAEKVLRAQRLKGFYIESSVTSLENKPDGGVRAAVSVVLATYPGRDMRAVMQGAATVLGGGDLKSQAVEAAFKSALRQLPQALGRE